jgi:hypothetical protein
MDIADYIWQEGKFQVQEKDVDRSDRKFGGLRSN